MKVQYLLLTMFIGVILTVHLSMNGRVGSALNNAPIGNALFWCIGAITACLIGLTGWHSGALAGLKDVPPIMLTAGALGATLVFAIAWLVPQVGPGPFFVVMLGGQVLAGLVLSHMGWLGPQQSISASQIVGAVIMMVGVYLTTRV
jgi:transporter family-2 protein